MNLRRLHSVAEDRAGRVLTERSDRYRIDGVWISYVVMGIFEVEGGVIKAWRDHFDLAENAGQALPHPHSRPAANVLNDCWRPDPDRPAVVG